MMEQVKATDALSPADVSQIIQRVQAASPAKVPQSPARSRDSSGRGRRRSSPAAKQGDEAVASPSNADKFEWEVEAKDIICVRLLGSGSFGEVWRGVWLGTPIAVKKVRYLSSSLSFSSRDVFQVRIGSALDPQTQRDFRREVDILSKVKCGACSSTHESRVTTRGALHTLAFRFDTSIASCSWAHAPRPPNSALSRSSSAAAVCTT
jgi:hypothetical protein